MTLESKQRRPRKSQAGYASSEEVIIIHALKERSLHSSVVSFQYTSPGFLFNLDHGHSTNVATHAQRDFPQMSRVKTSMKVQVGL